MDEKNTTHDLIRAMPKIELHRHLEGSWRLETLSELARTYSLPIDAYEIETIRPHVQMMPNEPRTWAQFLDKFRFLRQFFKSKTIIDRMTQEAIADAAADNIKYMELRFTPHALNNILQDDYAQVIEWVCDASQVAAEQHNIIVRLIISLNRHEVLDIAELVLEAALAHKHNGVVGIDLAGQEAAYSCRPFQHIFERAKSEGLGVTVHAGEWAGANSVYDAVDIGAMRIGHGTRAIEDPTLIDMLIKREIVLETCPTSNIDSGVITHLEHHPLPQFLEMGVCATINTDDPLISNITLSDELCHTVDTMSLSLDKIKQLQLTAAKAAFLPADERAALISNFENWLLT